MASRASERPHDVLPSDTPGRRLSRTLRETAGPNDAARVTGSPADLAAETPSGGVHVCAACMRRVTCMQCKCVRVFGPLAAVCLAGTVCRTARAGAESVDVNRARNERVWSGWGAAVGRWGSGTSSACSTVDIVLKYICALSALQPYRRRRRRGQGAALTCTLIPNRPNKTSLKDRPTA